MQSTKSPEKLKELPRARTLRSGSYRLLDRHSQAVTVKATPKHVGNLPRLNPTDWFLLNVETAMETGWENAEIAYYQGLDEGFQSGLQRCQVEVKGSSALLVNTLKTIEESILLLYQRLEGVTVRLALEVAEIIVGQAAQDHQDLVKQTVKRALSEAADKTKILVRVNPSDFDRLKQARNEIIGLSEGIEHFKIEADAQVALGSCRLITPSGLVDADFHTQLNELRRALLPNQETKS